MSPRQIFHPEEVLALSNVINPGGQRLGADGKISPGLPLHETNCALVALATAAFIQDGTEVSAPAAPSALLINGNGFLVQVAATRTTSDSEKIRITIVDIDDRWRFHDDLDFQETFSPQETIDKVRDYLLAHKGHSVLVHGQTENAHHWFNITPEGEVIDIQIGEKGDHLLTGQLSHEGLRRYEQLELIIIPKDISGKEIIEGAEAMHQFNGMLDLARHLQQKLDPEYQIDLIRLIENISDNYVNRLVDQGSSEKIAMHNHQTHEWFNQFCGQLETLAGKEKLLNALTEALEPYPEHELPGGTSQTWMAEATFREPGSTQRTTDIADTFSARCPILKEAFELSQARGTHQVGDSSQSLDL